MWRKLRLCALLLLALFLAPSLWFFARTPILTPDQAAPAEAAIVFGAIVRSDEISELHRERLNTAIALYDTGQVQRIVVSNAPAAARVMAEYLSAQGLPEEFVEIDPHAIRTPDTCHAEAARTEPRRVILISQRFHLPRIAAQCARYGLAAQFVMADSPDRPPAPWFTRLRIRSQRFLRETSLIWAHLLGLYPETGAP